MAGRTSLDLQVALASFLKRNRAEQKRLSGLYKKLSAQNPRATVVWCSDSRVHEGLFNIEPNRVFAIRNIGNQIATAEGSVKYGVEHLHTQLLLILGHTDCGAIKAAVSVASGKKMEDKAISREVGQIVSKLKAYASKGIAELAALNVDSQVAYAMKLFRHQLKSGSLLVAGGIIDLHNVHGKGHGSIIITNVNGVRK